MKNYVSLVFILIMMIFVMSCEKDISKNESNNDSTEDVAIFKMAIKDWDSKKGNIVVKNVNVFNYDNPMEYAGVRHNELLDSVYLEIGFESLTLTKLLSYYEVNYNVATLIDESQIIDRVQSFYDSVINNDGSYSSSFVDGLIGVSQSEKDVLNSYYSALKAINSVGERVEYSKYLESVILNSSFDQTVKDRLLQAFSIFRHSTYYWDNYFSMQPGGQNSGGMSMEDVIDSIAYHWATHADHEIGVFEDGASVNIYASEVSLFFTIILGAL